MNTSVRKEIKGQRVTARPVFKGGVRPAYWLGAVNDHTLPRVFPSALDVFRFVEQQQH